MPPRSIITPKLEPQPKGLPNNLHHLPRLEAFVDPLRVIYVGPENVPYPRWSATIIRLGNGDAPASKSYDRQHSVDENFAWQQSSELRSYCCPSFERSMYQASAHQAINKAAIFASSGLKSESNIFLASFRYEFEHQRGVNC
jgi:hypothetical protein